MKYHLRTRNIGPAPELLITEEQYQQAKDANAILVAAFALEETYDLLLENYVEVEQELLAAAVAVGARNRHGYDDFFELRSTINRRVVNLLTSTRLYLDQAPQHLAICTGDQVAARNSLKQRTDNHYDGSFAYRFLDALRNHVQHSGLAVHRMSINNKWVGVNETNELHVSVQPITSRRYLQDDAKFKKTVLLETPEEVDIAAALREYLQRLGDIHKLLRSIIDPAATSARVLIQGHIDNYASINSGQTLGLAAIHIIEGGDTTIVPLFLSWDDVRIKLADRNSTLGNLTKRVVTSCVR